MNDNPNGESSVSMDLQPETAPVRTHGMGARLMSASPVPSHGLIA